MLALAKDAYRVALATFRVMGDSTKTHEIHRVEEITGRPRYRAQLEAFRASPEGQRMLRDRPELSTRFVDYAHLRTLPASTLGGAYVRHLDDNKLTADYQAAETRHVDDPDMAFLMRRFRQTHDVWHALLGLGITGHEEVIIHWFSYGQLRLPVSGLIMVFGTLKHLVLERRWAAFRHSLLESYRAGRDAAQLLPVVWEDLWEQPIADVRARYGLHVLERSYLD